MTTIQRHVQANGISIAVSEAGDGPPAIMLHGFPELSYSWRSQLSALSAAGWRAIAPDLRGYGETGAWGDRDAYSMANLSRDVIGLMDTLELERAVIIGHDFGGALAWSIARDHAARVAGVVSLSTPYTRRGSRDLVETMRLFRGETNYMVQFQQPGIGEALLERDVAATFHGLMRSPALSITQFDSSSARLRALPMTLFVGEPDLMGAPIMSEGDLQVYIAAFERNGFTGPLNWYRNLHRNWVDTEGVDDIVHVPALMISGADDFFLPPATLQGLERYVPDVEVHIIEGCGHWIQYERPTELNQILVAWLERRMRPLF